MSVATLQRQIQDALAADRSVGAGGRSPAMVTRWSTRCASP